MKSVADSAASRRFVYPNLSVPILQVFRTLGVPNLNLTLTLTLTRRTYVTPNPPLKKRRVRNAWLRKSDRLHDPLSPNFAFYRYSPGDR